MKKWGLVLVVLLFISTPSYGVLKSLKKPNWSPFKKDEAQKAEVAEPVVDTAAEVVVVTNPEPEEIPVLKVTDLSDEQLEQKRKFTRLVKTKQFAKALELSQIMPVAVFTFDERDIIKKLEIFDQVEALQKENAELFKPDESLGEAGLKTLSRLYRESQKAILDGNTEMAKDLLIQTLFMDRQYYRSKKLLELGLSSPVGSYQIDDVQARYWRQSEINFYSGYPEKAVNDLKVLEFIDSENSLVFERMGSSYYSMGKTKEAIQSWKRALYLAPEKKELGDFIKNAEQEVKRLKTVAKQRAEAMKNRKQEKKSDVPMTLLRVVNDSNTAYSYAQEVREEMNGIRVDVEEMDNGKWAVKIPQSAQPKK